MNIKLCDLLTLSAKEYLLSESLTILKEIQLSVDNAAPIKGGLKGGSFVVGDSEYDYTVTELPSNIMLPGDKEEIKLEGTVVDIGFTVKGDNKDFASNLPKGGKANLIKIYSTIYKVLTLIAKAKSPNNILLTSYDASGYFPYYNNLTKTNNISGYSRKTIINWEHEGQRLTSIVLKRT